MQRKVADAAELLLVIDKIMNLFYAGCPQL